MRCGRRIGHAGALRLPSCLMLLAGILAACAKPQTVVVPSAPAPSRPPATQEAPPSPPALLAPQVGSENEGELKQRVEARIDGAERLYHQIDQKKLAEDQWEVFLTVRSFLSGAKEALSLKDFLRALNLADKAQILAQELLRSIR